MLNSMLVCFDFDKTLTTGRVDECLKNLFYKDAISYVRFLREHGAAVAIVTFNCGTNERAQWTYPSLMGEKFVTQELLRAGFTEEELANIPIIAGLDSTYYGKHQHIEDAKIWHQAHQPAFQPSADQVTLYDDEEGSCMIAQQAGYHAICVPQLGISGESRFWREELRRLENAALHFKRISSFGAFQLRNPRVPEYYLPCSDVVEALEALEKIRSALNCSSDEGYFFPEDAKPTLKFSDTELSAQITIPAGGYACVAIAFGMALNEALTTDSELSSSEVEYRKPFGHSRHHISLSCKTRGEEGRIKLLFDNYFKAHYCFGRGYLISEKSDAAEVVISVRAVQFYHDILAKKAGDESPVSVMGCVGVFGGAPKRDERDEGRTSLYQITV